MCLIGLKASDEALEEKKIQRRIAMKAQSPRTTTKGLLFHLLCIPARGTPGKAKCGTFKKFYDKKKKGSLTTGEQRILK